MANNCTHETKQLIKKYFENYHTGEQDWEYDYETISHQEDLDNHRFQCTMCGEVGYYSNAAYEWFVNRVPSPIKGLGQEIFKKKVVKKK